MYMNPMYPLQMDINRFANPNVMFRPQLPLFPN